METLISLRIPEALNSLSEPMPPDANIPPPLPSSLSAASVRWWHPKPVDVKWCILINLAACPGLGTLLARRRGGVLQLTLMLVGFVLVVLFMGYYVRAVVQLLQSAQPDADLTIPQVWMAWWGGGLCIASWLWSAASSWSMWKAQKTQG